MLFTRHNKMSLPPSEWFVPFSIDSVPQNGKTLHLTAEPENLKAIAKRLDVLEVKNLSADVSAELQNGGHILYLHGTFTAGIVQECVKTLEPIESHIADSFEAWYAAHDRAVSFSRAKQNLKAMEEGDEVQILDEKDDPEPLVDGQVDLGEVIIQFLSLSVDPFPRKHGDEDEAEADQGDKVIPMTKSDTAVRPNPFAALKNWRPKD